MVAGQIARQGRSLGWRLNWRPTSLHSILFFLPLLIVLFPFDRMLIRELFTLPIKLPAISQQFNTRCDMSMPASTVLMIPIIALFLACGRLLEQGPVAGGAA